MNEDANAQFIQVLQNLGFSKKLGDISWLISINPRISSIFDWINSSISKDNSIPINFTENDIKYYKSLETKGLTLQEDFETESLLHNEDGTEEIKQEIDEIESEIALLEEQCDECTNQKQQLEKDVDNIKKREFTITQKLIPNLNHQTSESNLNSIRKVEEVKKSMSKIKLNGNEIINDIINDNGPLFCQIGCELYREADQHYKTELSNYIDKYFNKVNERNGNFPSPSIFNMNELNEKFELIRGMSQNEYDEVRHEIERLQKVKYNSEMNNVKVIIENELTIKEYQLLQTYNSNLNYYTLDKFNNFKVNDDIELKVNAIKQLCSEISLIESSSILLGDYEEKEKREMNVISEQKKIIQLLQNQRIHHLFILSEITLEYNNIKYLIELINGLIKYTDNLRSDCKKRENVYNNLKEIKRYNEDERNTIDNNDIIYLSLYNIINKNIDNISNNLMIINECISWDKIYQMTNRKLKLDEEYLKKKNSKFDQVVNNINVLNNDNKMLYEQLSNYIEENYHPLPHYVGIRLKELENKSEILTNELNGIMNDPENGRNVLLKVLNQNELLRKYRNIFIDFYLNPSQLINMKKMLEDKLYY